ncbi:his operon leader peptide [Proteus sp. GOKU]|uniref:his operon leader peptide n=1 Tax=Proteus columbae TaxID=1987580 RepID=A0A6I7DE71_9GAMM|nr:his operon leader peptide [Proteus vulgaris]AZH00504.1 his operon leader peptide [Proteus mirabilis]QGW05138.1 his operon leader peptide [Proteus terrae subsp. cibarius]QHN12483.1 his operon leader peptide [Proteus columbae]QPB81385.1 his operon leader peptide [Proteus sp. GOKU]
MYSIQLNHHHHHHPD